MTAAAIAAREMNRVSPIFPRLALEPNKVDAANAGIRARLDMEINFHILIEVSPPK